MKYKSSRFCSNCHYPLPYKAKFCAHCGQKTDTDLMSVWGLLKQVWFRVLHLESRSLRFLWRIFIPGQVAREYLAGKQKRYPPPVRFFFVVMFIFLFTLNHLVGTDDFRLNTNRAEASYQKNHAKKTDGKNFYEKMREYAELKRMRQEFDSLPPHLRTSATQAAIDSLLQRTYGGSAGEIRALWAREAATIGSDDPDSIPINLGFRQIKIGSDDIFQKDAETIIQDYRIQSWTDKVFVRQGLRAMKDPDSLIQAYLGSLAWAILALIGFMAGVLALLYWRQRRYYVEHFIFLLNEHTGLFLALTLALWVNYFYPLPKGFWIILLIWAMFSPYLAIYRFYGQSKWMTFLKGTVFSVAYLVGFILLFLIGLLVVFFLF